MLLIMVLIGAGTVAVMSMGIGYIAYLEHKRLVHNREVREIYLDLSRKKF